MAQADNDAERESIDMLSSSFGTRQRYGWRSPKWAERADQLFDTAARLDPRRWLLAWQAARLPVRRIHVVSVDVPGRRAGLDAVLTALQETRHSVSVSLVPMGQRGKFENINLALQGVDLSGADWLFVTDDDIAFPKGFTDRFVYACEAAKLGIAQPAHRFKSHTTWEITQRVWNSLARTTHFVECGPLTAIHSSVFKHIVPFPETRWAWGIDLVWGEIARREGFRIGIVDATPIEHLRPVAGTYDFDAAIAEAQQLLAKFGVRRSNREILKTTAVLSRL